MESDASLVYKFLPQLLQRRMHRIPSLRRTISWSSKPEPTLAFTPFTTSRPSTADSDSSCTPPPSYRTSRTPSRHDITSGTSTPAAGQLGRLSITYGVPEGSHVEQASSGIIWKYADQGMSPLSPHQKGTADDFRPGMQLLDHSLHESCTLTARDPTQTFPRQLYIHACTYLLRALPTEMSAEETISIQNALPREVREGIARQSGTSELVARLGSSSDAAAVPAERSIVHRTISYIILQLFLVFNMLLPYIKLLLGVAYRFERKHRISKRAFSAGVQGVDAVGKRGVELSKALCSLNDGKVGQSMNEVMVWWIRSVTGGIHEGVGEGLSLVGVNSATMPKQSMFRNVHEEQ